MVALILLATAAVLAGPVAKAMKMRQVKEPLPLRVPLSALSPETIAPYRVVERTVLDPAVVDALGTEQYLSWLLEDPGVPLDDPLRRCRLLVTYYSGSGYLVPHTPDVCYLGGGYQPAQPHENMEVAVSALGPAQPRLPIRVCTFAKTAVFERGQLSVVYTFYCNGKFVATRSGVRVLYNTWSNKYAYFSKVEVSFPGATRAQTVEGAQKVFGVVLPELIRAHWPDFEAAEAAARRRENG